MRPHATLAGALLLTLAAAAGARAATCPSTCVTFDEQADAEQFVSMVAQGAPADLTAFLKARIALNSARFLPTGTQFVLLAEHKVASAKSSYYGVHLPGGADTKYLVAVK